jgi:flagellar motor switch protein FliG
MAIGKRQLRPADKAAIVLLALGEDLAGELLSRLPRAEARHVVEALQALGRVDEDVTDAVLTELATLLQSLETPRQVLLGDPASARRLLRVALGQAAADDVDLPDDGAEALRATVARFDAKSLAQVLRKEHPQTMALILAHAEAKLCGETLRELPAPLQIELVQRIARLDPVDPDTLHELDAALREAAETAGRTARTAVGGAPAVAAMLNALDSSAAKQHLEQLDERDPELAAAVRALMFTFDDLVRLDDRSLQELIKGVAEPQLLLALRGAGDELRDRLFSAMSERRAKMLRAELVAMRPVRKTDIETAQKAVAELARKLLDEGRIMLAV